ncbi:MAG TPA: hypothetical protein VHU85_00185 [Acidimicrobiales bacterium]|jgi:hypothetical protein|nr:hypothetical protein [Acidimicrobiales bacterium]
MALGVPTVAVLGSPASAGAATPAAASTDPLGPTIAQLQAFHATALANAQGLLAVPTSGIVTDDLALLLNQPGCAVLTVEVALGLVNPVDLPKTGCIL